MDNATFQTEVNLRALREAIKTLTWAPQVVEITIAVPTQFGSTSEQILVLNPGVVKDGTTTRIAVRAAPKGYELGTYVSKPSRYPGETDSTYAFDTKADTPAEVIETMLLAEIGLQALAGGIAA